MKASSVFSVAIILAFAILLVLHLHINPFAGISIPPHRAGGEGGEGGLSMAARPLQYQQLVEIISVQNKTINLLENVLSEKVKIPKLSNLLNSEKEKEAQIKALTERIKQLENDLKKQTSLTPVRSTQSSLECPPSSSSQSPLPPPPTSTTHNKLLAPLQGMDKDCEMRYGMSLIDIWSRNREVWCDDEKPDDDPTASKLICYPYHQAHKKLDGRGPDLFCEATNFFIDFSKVHGEAGTTKPPRHDQYLAFDRGSLFSPSCKKTDKFRAGLFMPHHSLQMNSFLCGPEAQGLAPPASSSNYDTVTTTTYLLARDEDCENSFHSTADFMGMFVVMSALNVDPHDQQVMLFDKHTDGPYFELIQKAFSPKHPVLRHAHYQKKKVLFKRLVFHLESPAGLIFPKVSRPDPMRCHLTTLFTEYRKFVLQAFDLLNVPPPEIPTVTLSLRHRTPHKNVGRILQNEEEVVRVLKEGNMMDLHVIDAAKMTFGDQLRLIRNTNVLVGVHGAGLMFIMFAAEEAVLVELHPSYRQDRHFRHAARVTGKIYMPLRATQSETCQGSSDNVVMPIDEFRKTIDGALRIARNFDDGLSECGLVCPLGILALDAKLDGVYQRVGLRKGAPINTHFPCG